MGTEREYFIFYGVKTEDMYQFTSVDNEGELEWFKKYEDEDKYRNYIITNNKEPYKIFALSDGRDGLYSCFGILYNRYGQDRWCEDRDIEEEFEIKDLRKLHKLFLQEVESRNINLEGLKPKLHIIRRYT